MGTTAELRYEGTMLETLGIKVIDASPERVVLEMEVTPAVHQPMGLLHGGASAALAETAASIGAYMNCDPDQQFAVGIELNISHLRAMRSGTLTATATPVRTGRTTHVWTIGLVDGAGKDIATARCTLAVRPWTSLKA